jgi:DNA polymerase III sliding clamp (beta) subunit (PCNA family)
MTHIYTTTPSKIQAVHLAAGYEAVRPQLSEVFFELYKDGTCSLTATDGHRLHSIHNQSAENVVDSFLLSNDIIEKIKALMLLAKKHARNHPARRLCRWWHTCNARFSP